MLYYGGESDIIGEDVHQSRHLYSRLYYSESQTEEASFQHTATKGETRHFEQVDTLQRAHDENGSGQDEIEIETGT